MKIEIFLIQQFIDTDDNQNKNFDTTNIQDLNKKKLILEYLITEKFLLIISQVKILK